MVYNIGSFVLVLLAVCFSHAACEELSPLRNSVEGSTQCKYGWLPMTTGASQSQHMYTNLHRFASLRSSVSDLRYAEQELQHQR